MTDLPDNAIRVVLAAVMPSQEGDPPDRIRVVVTDVEVERTDLWDPSEDDDRYTVYYEDEERPGDARPLWREVPRD